jgi:predicted nucleic acid-binding protein
MEVVLDATALIAYLKKENGFEKVQEKFIKASETNKNILMSTINWGEVIYLIIKHEGIEEAEKIQKVIDTFPIKLVEPDPIITKQAALYKAIKKLPYVDSFAAAMTKINEGELVTGDNDFKLVQDEIKIIWIKN